MSEATPNMRNLTRLSRFQRSAALSYVLAALGVTAAVIAGRLLETYLQTSPIGSLLLCAIIFAAWFGGVGPGLAAIALSALAFNYFFLAPIYSLKFMLEDLLRIALFAIVGLFVVGLIESLRRARADLEDKVRDLEKLNAVLRIGETYLAEAQRLSHTGSFWLERLERRNRLVRGELQNIRVRPRDQGHDRNRAQPGLSGRRRACPAGDRPCNDPQRGI